MALIAVASLVYAMTKHVAWRWDDIDAWGSLPIGAAFLAILAYPKWYVAFGRGSRENDEPARANRQPESV
ncbi:MAG: hypothetical protein NVS3B7_15740 [Candidatus Elarobacter sp.]